MSGSFHCEDAYADVHNSGEEPAVPLDVSAGHSKLVPDHIFVQYACINTIAK